MLNDSVGNTNENFERYRDRLTKFSSEFELGLFLFIARKSLYWILLFFTLAGISAFLYLRYAQRVYQAKATIQINSNNKAKQILNVGEVYESQDGLAEAIEVLRSKLFIKRVVSKIDLFVCYYNEGTFKENELYSSSPFVADINIKNNDYYNKKFYITFEGLKGGKVSYGDEENQKNLSFTIGQWVNTDNFDFKIDLINQQSPGNFKQKISQLSKMYFAKYDENTIVADIQSRLELSLLNDQAKTVGLTIKDFNPAKAADIV
ncbi:MAG: Wzz/FepE/Etk N-terminal domain-containing protein, partial [Bacteroidia bacterium]